MRQITTWLDQGCLRRTLPGRGCHPSLSILPVPCESYSSFRSLEAFATPRGRTGSPDTLGGVVSRLCDLVRRCCSSSVWVDNDSVDRVLRSVSVPISPSDKPDS